MTRDAPVSFALLCNRVRYLRRHRRWAALARAVWVTVVLRYGSEDCQECGRGYREFTWWAPQPLWDTVMPTSGGLLCPRCFTAMATAAGYRLTWTPMVVAVDGVPTTNWWLDQTRDVLLMGEPDPGYFPGGKVRQPQPTWARVAAVYPVDAPSPYPDANLAP